MNTEQIKIYEHLLDVVRSCDKRSQIVAAIEAEMAKITGANLFELLPEKPKIDIDRRFSDFWLAYPKRKGSNPRSPAEKSFAKAVAAGVDPATIMNGVDKLKIMQRADIGTGYIPQAVTWLNQKRWTDYGDLRTVKLGQIDAKEARRLEALAISAGNLG